MLHSSASRIAAVVLSASGAVQAQASPAVNAVNSALIASVRGTSQNPPRASRAMVMVNTAVFDAVNAGIGLRYQSYAYAGGRVTGVSSEAVAIAAGYRMMEQLYPTRTALLVAEKQAKLAALNLSPAKLAASVALGEGVANTQFSARTGDGNSSAQTPYVFGSGPGAYQQTTAATQPQLPGWGNVTPFVMASGNQFRVAPPPALGSAEFISAFNEVRDIGCVGCGTQADEDSARFWEDGGGSFTPAGHWLDIANNLALAQGLSTIEAARLMASVGAGLGDAAISSWDSKYFYNFWRPQTAIALCTLSTCGVEGQSGWVSKASANTPSYTSGNGTFAGAAASALISFFGTDAIPFCSNADPTSLGPAQRCFATITAAADEGTFSRTQAGIHFRFDNEAAFGAGSQIGQLSLTRFSQAGVVPEPASWAMLIAGFGLVGAAARRRRVATA